MSLFKNFKLPETEEEIKIACDNARRLLGMLKADKEKSKKRIKNFIEKGADLEHIRWVSWQKYLHSLCVKNKDGSLTIPKERVKHWKRQIRTPYNKLSEKEKEYDRIEVRKYLSLIRRYFYEKSRFEK